MKKFLLISLLSLLFFCDEIMAQPLPRDVATIEALIGGHKSIWNRLKTRQTNETVNYGLSNQVSDLSKEYETVRDKAFDRIRSTYTNLVFAKDVADVLFLLKDVGATLPKFIELAFKANVKYPMMYHYYMETYNGIRNEISSFSSILSVGLIWDGTMKEKFDQLHAMRSSLEVIKMLLEKTVWMGNGIVALGADAGVSWSDVIKQEGLDKKAQGIAKDIYSKYKQYK